jgi:hypothetical protein
MLESIRGRTIHNNQQGQEYKMSLKQVHGFEEFHVWTKQLESIKYNYQL